MKELREQSFEYQNIVDLEVVVELMATIKGICTHYDKRKFKKAKMLESTISIINPNNTKNILNYFRPLMIKLREEKITQEQFCDLIDFDYFKPQISIIIPVYNVAPYLRKCLDSILIQTFKNIEIICTDDASTDNSLEILEEYAKKDDRIKILKHKKNLGVSCARDSALQIAGADYLMFIDPDDSVERKFCEIMYNTITKNNSDLAVCNVNIEVTKDMTTNRGYTNDKNYANVYSAWCWNKIFKKSIVYKYGIIFPKGLLGEDAYFCNCYRLVSSGKFEIINEKLYTYLIRKDSLMSVIDKPDNPIMFDSFEIADLTYNFFKKQNRLNEVYKSFFYGINYGIKYFTEKNWDVVALKIYNLIKNKKEIKISKDCFEVYGVEYKINNEAIFNRIKKMYLS